MVLEDALTKAWAEIRARDLAVIARSAGLRPPDASGRMSLMFLGREFVVIVRDAKVLEEGKSPARQEHALIVLHYLLGVREGEPKGHLISFRELEGGDVYYSAFEGRSIKRVVEAFGERPELLERAALEMGGRRAPLGDVGVCVDALPKVPVTIAIWRGDEEVPSSTCVLLDDTVRSYLPTEDVAVVCGLLVGELVRRAGR